MSLGLLLGLMLRRPFKPTRLVLGLALAIPVWIAIIYSGSRGGLVSMIAQILFVALLVFIASPGKELLRTEDLRSQAGRHRSILNSARGADRCFSGSDGDGRCLGRRGESRLPFGDRP